MKEGHLAQDYMNKFVDPYNLLRCTDIAKHKTKNNSECSLDVNKTSHRHLPMENVESEIKTNQEV